MTLDDLHAMNRIRWRSTFRKKDRAGATIDCENIYLTRAINAGHKVFAYITGVEQLALKKTGLE